MVDASNRKAFYVSSHRKFWEYERRAYLAHFSVLDLGTALILIPIPLLLLDDTMHFNKGRRS